MAGKTDTWENILECGVDLINRRIYFGALSESSDETGSEFTWRSCERAIRAIQVMELEAPKKPIELHMHSEGGCPYSMLRLMDVIQSCSCQIKFYGCGEIASAATWVMAVCDERYLYPNTLIVIHDSSAGGEDTVPSKLSDQYIKVDGERNLQAKLNQIFADNSRMPVEFWDEMVKRDMYLTAEETIALGLADKIVEYKKRGNLRRMRIALLQKEPEHKDFNRLLRKLRDRTYMGKQLRIELHVPEEKFDKNVVVDNTPTVTETAASPAPSAPVETGSTTLSVEPLQST